MKKNYNNFSHLVAIVLLAISLFESCSKKEKPSVATGGELIESFSIAPTGGKITPGSRLIATTKITKGAPLLSLIVTLQDPLNRQVAFATQKIEKSAGQPVEIPLQLPTTAIVGTYRASLQAIDEVSGSRSERTLSFAVELRELRRLELTPTPKLPTPATSTTPAAPPKTPTPLPKPRKK